MAEIVICCDGACEPANPGGYGCSAFCVDGEETEEVKFLGKKISISHSMVVMSNNIAEYVAAGMAIRWLEKQAKPRGITRATIRTDSKLVVEQMSRRWNCNSPHLLILRNAAEAILKKLPCSVRFQWVSREENTRADALSKSLYAERHIFVTNRR